MLRGGCSEEEHLQRILEEFVLNNTNLENLESEISNFNVFEAIGIRHQEIKHSRTLAYLLDPHNQHGLGQVFLKKLVMGMATSQRTSVSPIDVDFSDLSDAEVRCEWKNIDILIVCPTAQIVVVIENKVHAGESNGQLSKYKNTTEIAGLGAGFRHVYVFLTIDGHEPAAGSDRNDWICYSHADLIEILQNVYDANQQNLGTGQDVLIRHYIELMRRHILEDGKIAELARKIYSAHKEAIDLIFEHRPDNAMENKIYLEELVRKQDGLELLNSTKTWIRFRCNSWRFSPDWSSQKRNFEDAGVLFEFENRGNKVKLVLLITDVPNRENKSQLFSTLSKKLQSELKGNGHWPRVWVFDEELGFSEDEQLDVGEAQKKIASWFKSFLDGPFGTCTAAVNETLQKLPDSLENSSRS